MKSIKVREITVCEMMAINMKRLPPTSSNLEIVTAPFELEVQP
jgi:hypothetical protein